MIKMYNVEVLSKFPVVQHFRFGSLFKWDTDPNATTPTTTTTSVHISNQPTKAPSSSTSANIADNSIASIRTPGISTIPTLTSSGTSAPWARSTNTHYSARLTPQQTGIARSPRYQPVPVPIPTTPQPPPPPGESFNAAEISMPPPTRAPWAKPPPS